MKLRNQLAILAGSFLLVACGTENLVDEATPPTPVDSNSQEVVLMLKNKLRVKSVGTRADEPIATAEENYISSLDVYVFGSKDEAGPYTFQELLYFRDDAAEVVIPGVKTTSFNLIPTAEGTNGLLKMAKGLYVKLYCVANRSHLFQTDGGTGAVTEYTTFQSLAQSMPGQAGNVVTPGVPTEGVFKTLHTQVIDPAVVEPTADDVLNVPLPMTGANTTPLDLTDFGTSARMQLSLRLTRMVARFDIVNDASKSKFTIEKISMGKGQKHMQLFPIKPLTTVADALITYPERALSALTQRTPDVGTGATNLSKGAFYTWASPKEDKGYLILKGKFAINQTQSQEVTYQVPFEQIKNGVGSYIEVAHNHRYTIAITDADPYKLNVNFTVEEWIDGSELDPYNPENDFDADLLQLTPAESVGAYVLDNGNISLMPEAGSKFEFTMGSNAELEEQLVLAPGSEAWFKRIAVPITRANASKSTVFHYEVDDTKLADPAKVLPAILRIINKASGKRKEIKILPTQGPAVTPTASNPFESTFDPKTMTARIWNINDAYVGFDVVAETRSDRAETPTLITGSTATASDWISLSPASSATTANAQYLFSVTTHQENRDIEGFIEITSTASGAKTRIKVLLNNYNHVSEFTEQGNSLNVVNMNNENFGYCPSVTMPSVVGNFAKAKIDASDGYTVQVETENPNDKRYLEVKPAADTHGESLLELRVKERPTDYRDSIVYKVTLMHPRSTNQGQSTIYVVMKESKIKPFQLSDFFDYGNNRETTAPDGLPLLLAMAGAYRVTVTSVYGYTIKPDEKEKWIKIEEETDTTFKFERPGYEVDEFIPAKGKVAVFSKADPTYKQEFWVDTSDF